ncbi:MAG: hypothetical protein A2W90_20610 [Bacteroidetes bacterium GWF2_42_66]|nr:MAG: hypothetical protein A2W92_13395 [Bacteroidetes bacterium GWA2_42_15]OFX98513.1 MAG: hypothetical protein A2W89_08975 [Bacteroidetes bacterium GWE2_42_39]OFY42897.1 MAG: hypothetical protein A2W90_20610 [Bacteroidetes bacterium GWF2_42_66]HBL75305.1 hypothetical protein [Prolixibacteraceae bacterium]HCU61822.1 hypothetical protein [Prolixibacteraceae bacterium]
MNSEDILNLFDLVRNSPEEHWSYNKGRLLEILHDLEKDQQEGIIVEGRYLTIPMITNLVVESLQSVYKSQVQEEILYSPTTWMRFRKRLNDKISKIQRWEKCD